MSSTIQEVLAGNSSRNAIGSSIGAPAAADKGAGEIFKLIEAIDCEFAEALTQADRLSAELEPVLTPRPVKEQAPYGSAPGSHLAGKLYVHLTAIRELRGRMAMISEHLDL